MLDLQRNTELGKQLKSRLKEQLVGSHISMTDSIVSEVMGSIGFDFIWIDSEHSENSYTSIRNHITAVNAGGTPAIVRVARNDYNHMKRILEMGPQGIVVPMVNTPEEAEDAMRFCSYPPYGMRGFGPLRAVQYGLNDTDAYIADCEKVFSRFIQIETATAVKNLPQIVRNPHIDGYFFGPCDLSGSIGELGKIYGEHTQQYIRQAIAILRDAGKPIGVSLGTTDPEQIAFWRDLGINIISTGTDYDYILRGAAQNLQNVRTRVFT